VTEIEALIAGVRPRRVDLVVVDGEEVEAYCWPWHRPPRRIGERRYRPEQDGHPY